MGKGGRWKHAENKKDVQTVNTVIVNEKLFLSPLYTLSGFSTVWQNAGQKQRIK